MDLTIFFGPMEIVSVPHGKDDFRCKLNTDSWGRKERPEVSQLTGNDLEILT